MLWLIEITSRKTVLFFLTIYLCTIYVSLALWLDYFFANGPNFSYSTVYTLLQYQQFLFKFLLRLEVILERVLYFIVMLPRPYLLTAQILPADSMQSFKQRQLIFSFKV